jgi:hypothetical protein
VPGGASRRDCGTRQDELAACGFIIDTGAHVIPDLRDALPLIDEPWLDSVEDEARVDLGRFACRLVDIEPNLACRGLSGCRGLATRLGSLDEDRSGAAKLANQLVIYDPLPVLHGQTVS